MVSSLRWILRTIALIAVLILLARALVQYLPWLGTIPLIGAFSVAVDPVLQRLVERVGLPWSHPVRAWGMPAAAVMLVLLRGILDGLLARLQAAVSPTTAPAPGKAAPPASTGDATELRPAPSAPRQQSATGTAFMPAYAPAAPEAAPSRIDRYEILGELGRGAMGVVYKARDPKIGRVVAIKTISAPGTSAESAEYRDRFLLEAKSAGRLSHPGVVGVHDVTDDEQGRPCLVLEFVEGVTLDTLIAERRLPLPVALDYASQVARALAFAHGHGIIHRDVKPANVMVTAAGRAKLSDFGVAKIEGTSLTIAGQVLGTPAFMSPEQCRGEPIDPRSDIFSLGAVLYLLATARKPFPGKTFTAVAYQVVHEQPAPPSQVNPAVPSELDAIVSRCLAKAAADRYPSAGAVADDLDALRARLPASG